jgi:hypothetical protein
MRNLMPEKRLNSRGHLVTKWVKPEDAKRVSSMDFPLPVSKTPRPSISDQLDAVLDVLENNKLEGSDDVATFVYGAKPSTITFLYDHFSALDESDDYAWNVAWMAKEYCDDETVISYVTLYDIHDETLDDLDEVVSVLAGLHLSGSNREPLDPSNEDSVERYAALLKFTLAAFKEGEVNYLPGFKGCCASNEAVAQVIYDNPSRFDEICEFAETHPELVTGRDHTAIEEFLNDPTKDNVLTEGRL